MRVSQGLQEGGGVGVQGGGRVHSELHEVSTTAGRIRCACISPNTNCHMSNRVGVRL